MKPSPSKSAKTAGKKRGHDEAAGAAAGAAPPMSPPRPDPSREWKKSKMKTEDLLALLNSGFIREKEMDSWRAVAGDPYPMEKSEDEIPMFARFAEHGVALQASDFFKGFWPARYVGFGAADELLGQVLFRGNLLLAEVVDEGLPPVHVDHHDLLSSQWVRWDSGRWRRLRDGWRVKLVNEDTCWYLSAGGSKLRQDVCCNIVVADDVVELETIELVLELADF
jgi:hypothetical protein